jgi:two-component system, NtrC family, nitrogen regulation response regulator GlnG
VRLANVGSFTGDFTLLLIDDEVHFLQAVRYILHREGYGNVLVAHSGKEALEIVKSQTVHACFLDYNLGDMTGDLVLQQILEHHPEMPVVMLTGIPDPKVVVQCMKTGAVDYLLKPVDKSALLVSVNRIQKLAEARAENASLRQRIMGNQNSRLFALTHPEVFSEFITNEEAIFALFHYIETIAITNVPLLIVGESGTGKEVISKAVHRASGRSGRFIAENVSGIDDALFSNTMFGHVKGAYTGADVAANGLVQEASKGTLLLDEIGDLHLESQKKLLRLLQENEYTQVGGTQKHVCQCRILMATHQDLPELVKQGRFRADLLYRIQSHCVRLPSLRERKGDIAVLAKHFLEQAKQTFNAPNTYLEDSAVLALMQYDWPGNVRELAGVLSRVVSLHTNQKISARGIQDGIGTLGQSHAGGYNGIVGASSNGNGYDAEEGYAKNMVEDLACKTIRIHPNEFPTLKCTESILIDEALRLTSGNKTHAAALLGISREALSKRLNRKKK